MCCVTWAVIWPGRSERMPVMSAAGITAPAWSTKGEAGAMTQNPPSTEPGAGAPPPPPASSFLDDSFARLRGSGFIQGPCLIKVAIIFRYLTKAYQGIQMAGVFIQAAHIQVHSFFHVAL